MTSIAKAMYVYTQECAADNIRAQPWLGYSGAPRVLRELYLNLSWMLRDSGQRFSSQFEAQTRALGLKPEQTRLIMTSIMIKIAELSLRKLWTIRSEIRPYVLRASLPMLSGVGCVLQPVIAIFCWFVSLFSQRADRVYGGPPLKLGYIRWNEKDFFRHDDLSVSRVRLTTFSVKTDSSGTQDVSQFGEYLDPVSPEELSPGESALSGIADTTRPGKLEKGQVLVYDALFNLISSGIVINNILIMCRHKMIGKTHIVVKGSNATTGTVGVKIDLKRAYKLDSAAAKAAAEGKEAPKGEAPEWDEKLHTCTFLDFLAIPLEKDEISMIGVKTFREKDVTRNYELQRGAITYSTDDFGTVVTADGSLCEGTNKIHNLGLALAKISSDYGASGSSVCVVNNGTKLAGMWLGLPTHSLLKHRESANLFMHSDAIMANLGKLGLIKPQLLLAIEQWTESIRESLEAPVSVAPGESREDKKARQARWWKEYHESLERDMYDNHTYEAGYEETDNTYEHEGPTWNPNDKPPGHAKTLKPGEQAVMYIDGEPTPVETCPEDEWPEHQARIHALVERYHGVESPDQPVHTADLAFAKPPGESTDTGAGVLRFLTDDREAPIADSAQKETLNQTYALRKISVQLSKILRHGAPGLGIDIRPDGFCRVDELLELDMMKRLCATQAQSPVSTLKRITQTNDKRRFEMTTIDGHHMIRAVQGHSIDAVSDHELAQPLTLNDDALPKECIHGTYMKHWQSIQAKGLIAGGLIDQANGNQRNHIHFATYNHGDSNAGAPISGMRAGCDLAIHLDLRKALAAGIPFFKAKNDVILTSGIDGVLPVKFIQSVIDLKTGKEIYPINCDEWPNPGRMNRFSRCTYKRMLLSKEGESELLRMLLSNERTPLSHELEGEPQSQPLIKLPSVASPSPGESLSSETQDLDSLVKSWKYGILKNDAPRVLREIDCYIQESSSGVQERLSAILAVPSNSLLSDYVKKTMPKWNDVDADDLVMIEDKDILDMNGDPYFRLVGSCEQMRTGKQKKAKDTEETELQKRLKSLAQSYHADKKHGCVKGEYKIPVCCKANIDLSLRAQAKLATATPPNLNDEQKKEFAAAVELARKKYSDGIGNVPIRTYLEEGEFGLLKTFIAYEDKSSGASARYRNLKKAAWCKAHADEVSDLAISRLILLAVAGEQIDDLNAIELISFGCADVKEIFMKPEGHSPQKTTEGRFRLIWISSLVDLTVQALLHKADNIAHCEAYQAGTLTCAALGLGHSPDGLKHLVEAFKKEGIAHDNVTSDASAYDLSIDASFIICDGERRAANCADPYVARLVTRYSHLLCSHVLNNQGDVWLVMKHGVTTSGQLSTTTQNTFARSIMAAYGGCSGWTCAGDDLVGDANFDEKRLLHFGVRSRDVERHKNEADFTSHLIDSKTAKAVFLNVEKLLWRLYDECIRLPTNRERFGSAQYVLRDTPGVLQDLTSIIEDFKISTVGYVVESDLIRDLA